MSADESTAGGRRGFRERFSAAVQAFGVRERAASPAPQLETTPVRQRSELATRVPRLQRRNTYKAAAVSRLLDDWVASCLAPDIELRGDFRRLRARARDLARNNPHIAMYLWLLKSNVIGPQGIRLEPQVRNGQGELWVDVNDTIKAAWGTYTSRPVSADGEMSFDEYSELALETAATDGETFTRLVEDPDLNEHGLALQMIDSDLVDETFNMIPATGQGEVRLGVEVDHWGRRTGYWIREQWGYTPGQAQQSWRTYRLPGAEMLHIYRPRRPNQTRGTTWMAGAMLPLQHLQGYTEAELVAARTSAAKMGFVVTKDSSAPSGADENEAGTDTKAVEMEANPGSIEELDPGQEFQSWDPTHPTTAYADFVKSVLREVATGLGVSYNALANDLEGVNYSSMRHGLQAERDCWRMLQKWWVRKFLQPIYERWLNTAMLSGALILPRADWRLYTDVRWAPRRWPWVDPKSDIEATSMQLSLGLTSRTRVLAETTDAQYQEILEELKRETEEAAAANVKIDGYSSGPGAAATPTADDGAGGSSSSSDKPAADGVGDNGSSANGERAASGLRPRPAIAAALNGKKH